MGDFSNDITMGWLTIDHVGSQLNKGTFFCGMFCRWSSFYLVFKYCITLEILCNPTLYCYIVLSVGYYGKQSEI